MRVKTINEEKIIEELKQNKNFEVLEYIEGLHRIIENYEDIVNEAIKKIKDLSKDK